MSKRILRFARSYNVVTDSAIIAALKYAERGWPTIPDWPIIRGGFGTPARCACDKGTECRHPGKHPSISGGYKSATADLDFIKNRYPGSNVSIVTGNGLVVVDLDPRHGGFESMKKLEREYQPLPQAVRDSAVFSGVGGIHLYMRYSGKPLYSADGIFPGVDLKAERGKVTAPPSLHIAGKLYVWHNGAPPKRLPRIPSWLLKLLHTRAPQHVSTYQGGASGFETILTKDHPVGQEMAEFLGATDCEHYWKFECPAAKHQTPDAAFYPRPNGKVWFVCFSGDPCTHDQIARAVNALIDEEG